MGWSRIRSTRHQRARTAQTTQQPELAATSLRPPPFLFAGKLEKKNLSFPERAILIAFRGMEGDFRDWTEIKAWASGIADSLQPGS